MTVPIIFKWSGDAMEPVSRFRSLCDEEFVVGEFYHLDAVNPRSMASHNHYFARIKELWMSFPDSAVERFPTPEHARKFALIKCGYHDCRSIQEASKAAASRLAAFVRPFDEFAIVTVMECMVSVYTAKSQSIKAMGKAEFQKSKTDVIEYLESLIVA